MAIKEGTDKKEFFIDPKSQQTDTALRLESVINENNAKGDAAENAIESEHPAKKVKQTKKTDKSLAQPQPEPEKTDPSLVATAKAALDAKQNDTQPVNNA